MCGTTGLEEVAKRGREQRADHQSPAEPGSAPGAKEEVVDSEFGGGQDTEPLGPSKTGNSARHLRNLICIQRLLAEANQSS